MVLTNLLSIYVLNNSDTRVNNMSVKLLNKFDLQYKISSNQFYENDSAMYVQNPFKGVPRYHQCQRNHQFKQIMKNDVPKIRYNFPQRRTSIIGKSVLTA
uniref:Uncharacterized protein n=1 Tax=Cacopsylla melanoneura TaxID=428564 RepID=A0A8D8XJR7_9HEMI